MRLLRIVMIVCAILISFSLFLKDTFEKQNTAHPFLSLILYMLSFLFPILLLAGSYILVLRADEKWMRLDRFLLAFPGLMGIILLLFLAISELMYDPALILFIIIPIILPLGILILLGFLIFKFSRHPVQKWALLAVSILATLSLLIIFYLLNKLPT
jgi:hypothetical protein